MANWLRRKSFRVRLGALVATAVGVAVALAALASYIAVRHQLYSQLDSSLQSEATAALSPLQGGDQALIQRFLHRYNNIVLQAVEQDGSIANVGMPAGSPTLPVSASDRALVGQQSGSHFRTVRYEGQPYRVYSVPGTVSTVGSPSTPAVIQIAQPIGDIGRTLSDLRLILWLVAVSGVAVGLGLAYLVGRATIRPVERLTAAAEHVALTQDLAATIDDTGEDELARLARSFNSMLGALATSRQQQAQLISDAGHELRTPLTSLRTNIEVLLRVRDLPETDRAELLSDVHAQLEELTTLIGDVVELGRADEQQAEPIEVRLDSIVERAVDRARRRAPAVTFEVQLTAGSLRAQPVLLERAVLNVLDNAAKWSPPGGVVRVWLQRGAVWSLDVLDQGPGISAEDLPHVFDRFYRAEAARSLPGSGLGLAIVRQVVSAHGGTVSASSPPGGGTLIHIELPIVAEHEPPPAPGPDDESEVRPVQNDARPNGTGLDGNERNEPLEPYVGSESVDILGNAR